MKIKRPRTDLLVLEEFPYLIGTALGIFALVMLVISISSLSKDDHRELLGTMAGFSLAFFGFAVFFKKSRFEFDLAKGMLKWSRKGVFSEKGGTINLGSIENVILRPVNDGDGNIEYLVFLITNKGKVPFNTYGTNEKQVRVTYCNTKKADAENIAHSIREMFGMKSANLIKDSLSGLSSSNRIVSAALLAKDHYGLGLTDAMQHVSGKKEDGIH